VENPCKADLRRKYYWEYWPKLKEGSLIVVRKDIEFDILQFGLRVHSIGWRYVSAKSFHLLFEALTAGMRKVPTEDLDMLLLYYNEVMHCRTSERKILHNLIEAGLIRLEQVERAIVQRDNNPYCIAMKCEGCGTMEMMILFSYVTGSYPQYKCSKCSKVQEFKGSSEDFEEGT
jgi:hypothetical protein